MNTTSLYLKRFQMAAQAAKQERYQNADAAAPAKFHTAGGHQSVSCSKMLHAGFHP